MKHIRSADPWSTFLAPDERAAGASAWHGGETFMADAGRSHGGNADLPRASRRVLDALANGHGALTVEQLHDVAGLTLLEVADAVKVLRERGLVGLRREADDEIIRLTGPETGTASRDAGSAG